MTNHFSPRLTSSTQWTALPAEFTAKIQSIFANQFKRQAKLGEFVIEGRIFPQEIILRAGYLEHGRLKQINFEVSMDLNQKVAQKVAQKVTQTVTQTIAPKNSPSLAHATSDEEGEPTTNATLDKIYVGIDALGSLMEQYFELGEEDELDVPLRWQPFEFEGEALYLQQSTVNTRLEEEADRLLGLSEDRLVQEASFEQNPEDALTNAAIDSELAFEIQKAIRAGTYRTSDMDAEPDPSKLN